jgi:glutamine synthetase
VAANYGLDNSEEALKMAEGLHVETAEGKRRRSRTLPRSCSESARNLRKDRRFYEANGVFPRRLLDKTAAKLRAYRDRDLWKSLADKPDKIEKLLGQFLYYD